MLLLSTEECPACGLRASSRVPDSSVPIDMRSIGGTRLAEVMRDIGLDSSPRAASLAGSSDGLWAHATGHADATGFVGGRSGSRI